VSVTVTGRVGYSVVHESALGRDQRGANNGAQPTGRTKLYLDNKGQREAEVTPSTLVYSTRSGAFEQTTSETCAPRPNKTESEREGVTKGGRKPQHSKSILGVEV